VRALSVGAVSRNYFNLPLWIAQHAGLFNREGLSVAIELIEGIDEVTRRLAAGQLDLALDVTENTILNSEQGGRLEIIAGNVNRLPFSFIARPHIKRYADLRGARIGVSSIKAGSSSLVMQLLAAHGLHYPEDYTLLAVGPILSRWKMLQAGEIDGGLQGAPLDYIALDAGFSDLGNPRSQFPDFQFTSLDVDSDWARQNRDTVVAFLMAYREAHRWFYANKAGATEIAVRETGVEKLRRARLGRVCARRDFSARCPRQRPGGAGPDRGELAHPRSSDTLEEPGGAVHQPLVPADGGRFVGTPFVKVPRRGVALSLPLRPAVCGRRNNGLLMSWKSGSKVAPERGTQVTLARGQRALHPHHLERGRVLRGIRDACAHPQRERRGAAALGRRQVAPAYGSLSAHRRHGQATSQNAQVCELKTIVEDTAVGNRV